MKYQKQKEGDAPLNPEQTLMKVTADLVVDLELGVNSDNYLALSVDKLISMDIISAESEFIQTDLLPIDKVSAAVNDTLSILLIKGDAVTGGLSKVVKDSIAQLVAQISGIDLGLTLPDIGIVLRDLGADDSNSHVLITLDLLNKAEMAAAKAAGEQLTFVLLLNPQNKDKKAAAQVQSAGVSGAESNTALRSLLSAGQTGIINRFDDTPLVIGEEASIAIQGENPTPEQGPVQYRYRLDNGAWSVWKPRTSIALYKMDLGLHTLEICARTALLVEAKACQTVKLDVRY